MNMFDASIYHEMFDDKIGRNDNKSYEASEYRNYVKKEVKEEKGMNAENEMKHSYDMSMSAFPKNTSVAMAYVPYQQWEKPYTESVALDRGTMFPCLDKPYIGEEAVRNGYKR